MENQTQISNLFIKPPFEILEFSVDCTCIYNKNKEKWKKTIHFSTVFLHLLVLLCFTTHASGEEIWDGVIVTEADYQALQAFKHELDDPKGFLKSWNDSGFGACSGGWTGIKCAQGQVIVIQLPWKGLGGRISEKIGQFQALRKLSLHDNFIGGEIPRELGFLPYLRGLQLFSNRFSGSVPSSLGSCPLLQTLDISNNSLTGTIPETLANSTKLYRLNLSFNSFSGPIPISITKSRLLTFVSLQHNNLSGSIPDSWGNGNGFRLQYLAFDYNFLSGTIPASLSRLTELQDISLSHNKITGAIPDDIGKLSKLRVLDLSNNAINNSLPFGLSNLTSLVVLNLESNDISNQIPKSFDRLHNLSVLNLRRNQLSGLIPASLGNISKLSQLDLGFNKLNGEIPSSIANLESLNALNVSYNNLKGPVPSLLLEKFNASSFVGNSELCGYSSTTICPSEIAPVPVPAESRKRGRKISTKDIILIAAGSLLVVLVILVCILLCCLIRKRAAAASGGQTGVVGARSGEKGVPPVVAEGGEVETGGENGGKLVHFDGPLIFTADDLLCATAEIMGKSTYGTVYKATLEDGSQVAVKRLREKITKSQKEFETEVNIVGKIRHSNLLALRAYYLGPKGEKLLVFDYMPKGSLAAFLHARGPDTVVDWPTRMSIIQGITRGLCYLHGHEIIIHGNLTSTNILLDEESTAKIADFGLSRLMTAAANSNVIATAGALGYRAPELSKLKKANTKTDVYSLGVLILELLTGKSPGEAMNGVDLPQWVASVVKEEWTNEVFDLELMKDVSAIGDELLNTLKLALHCVDPSPSARPDIQQVAQQLEEIVKPDTAAAAAAASSTSGPSPPGGDDDK